MVYWQLTYDEIFIFSHVLISRWKAKGSILSFIGDLQYMLVTATDYNSGNYKYHRNLNNQLTMVPISSFCKPSRNCSLNKLNRAQFLKAVLITKLCNLTLFFLIGHHQFSLKVWTLCFNSSWKTRTHLGNTLLAVSRP